MTVRASLQTSTRVAALLVAAAIVLATPYVAVVAVRSGVFCVVPAKAAIRISESPVYASRLPAV